MTEKAYADILARAIQLLGRRVILHWVDKDGELCGSVGTLVRVTEPYKSSVDDREIPKQVHLENHYACVDIGRVIHLQQAR